MEFDVDVSIPKNYNLLVNTRTLNCIQKLFISTDTWL